MLARLIGKSNIYNFKIEIFGDIKTFDFLKVRHQELGDILTQVINITRDGDKLIGDCKVVGYRDSGVLKNIRTPFIQDAQIEIATDEFIEKTVGLNTNKDSFLGVLEHHPGLRISLDLKKAITRHIAVLAKSGAGKSYTVGVLLEEILKKKIPILILDPHNEYASLKYPNSDTKDMKRLEKFGLAPEGFLDKIKEYSPDTNINPQCQHVSLDINKLKPNDLMELLPQKLTPGQQSLLYNTLSNLSNRVNFDELIFTLSNEESNSKWSLISLIEQLKKLKIYSSAPTPLNELIKHGNCSIISLKGVEPYVQEAFLSGLLKELFESRKKEEIPPFFLVLEEAHNFCPERGFGELKTSKVIRTIAGEGRKFGIGLCVISQRPAKIDKNVVSQCTTQILMKITNPNDLKSVIASSEGVSGDSENEIQRLNIGTCLLTGVIDIPLKLNVRPRISKHGGETVDITLPYEVEGQQNPQAQPFMSQQPQHQHMSQSPQPSFASSVQSAVSQNAPPSTAQSSQPTGETEFVQFVAPDVGKEDAKVLLNSPNVKTELAPGFIVKMKTATGAETQLLIDRSTKSIVKKVFPYGAMTLSQSLLTLSETEKKLLNVILTLGDKFNPAELLIKTDVMFNEILRVCDNLANKGLLKKVDKAFEITGVMFGKELDKLNFLGQQKFEEVNFDVKSSPTISEAEIKNLLSMFGTVENMKEIYLLKYVA